MSLGVCSALEHLTASKMVLVRGRLEQAVLHLTVVLSGKILLGKHYEFLGNNLSLHSAVLY